MKTFGNILWMIFGGLIFCICEFIAGIICCITILFIPFGKQYFKFAKLTLAPFGKQINSNFSSHVFMNIIWLIFGGLELALGYYIVGGILFITVIGIPFSKQYFKLGRLAFAPFGSTVEKIENND